MKSTIDPYTLNEDHSRELISKYCRLNVWKYRKMEWDNDIDGEIEIFDDNRETTAKFIKIQLKTIDNPKSINHNSEYLDYDADIKFLNFCDVCDIPVLLIVFDIQNEIGYYLFVQKFIYEKLELTNHKWRTNKTSVRLKIPFENSLLKKDSRVDFEDVAFNGINTISQLRKAETFRKYYSVLNQKDSSHALALRTSVTVFIEKSFSSSKEALKILIPKINSHFIESVYISNEIRKEHFKGSKCQVIWLNFYDSIEQSNQGLPCCQTLWIDENLPKEARPIVSIADEVINGINIYWGKNYGMSEYVSENILDKGVYIPYLDKAFDKFFILYSKVRNLFDQYLEQTMSYNRLIRKLKRYSSSLNELNDLFLNFGFPPVVCNDIDIQIRSMLVLLDNVRLVVEDKKRNEDNVISCIKMYLKSIEETLPEYKYERKKIN